MSQNKTILLSQMRQLRLITSGLEDSEARERKKKIDVGYGTMLQSVIFAGDHRERKIAN